MESFIQTHRGIRVSLLDPQPEDIFIEDIAWSLARQCRFGGHCNTFYSVAQHSLMVSDILFSKIGSCESARAGLLHDAAEAYIIDLPSPVKALLPEYKEIEHRFQKVIETVFDLEDVSHIVRHRVKEADVIALATEARDLMANTEDWQILQGVKPDPLKIQVTSPRVAEAMFIDRFLELNASSGA